MKKTLIAIASVLAIVAGCAKNDIQPSAVVCGNKVTASIETDTKATLDLAGKYMVWQAGDTISVWDGVKNAKFTLTSGEGTQSGTFESDTTLEPAGTYYAVYPYQPVKVEEGEINIKFPESIAYNPTTGFCENYVDGGYSVSSNVMVAKQAGTDIMFKNLCSYIILNIKGVETQAVKSVVIEGKGGQYVNGPALVEFDESGIPSVTFYNEMGGEEAGTAIVVGFENPLALSEEGVKIPVAVAPVFENGFKATVFLTDDTYQEVSTSFSIARNKAVEMPVFTYAAKEVAQIGDTKYTTFADAIAAANESANDVTVKLISTFAPADAVSIHNAAGKTITLDLNGNSIVPGGTSECLTLEGGALVVKNGTIAQNEGTAASTIVVKAGTLTVESGTISNSNSTAISVPDSLSEASVINLNGGILTGEASASGVICIGNESPVTININGAEIRSTKARGIYTGAKTVLNMTSGKIVAARHCISFLGTITPEGEDAFGLHISGGEFYAGNANIEGAGIYNVSSTADICIEGDAYFETTYLTIYNSSSTTSTIFIKNTGEKKPYFYNTYSGNILGSASGSKANFSISGGYYCKSAGLTAARFATGCSCIPLATPITYNGKEFAYEVGISTAEIFKITDENDAAGKTYSTPSAVKAALFGETPEFTGSNVKVTLLEDFTLLESLEFDASESAKGKSYTLDLNGKTLTATNVCIKPMGYTNLTIQNGTLCGSDYYCLYPTGNSDVKLSSDLIVDYSGTEKGLAWVTGSSKFTCNGCTLKNSNAANANALIGGGNVSASIKMGVGTKLSHKGSGRIFNSYSSITLENGVLLDKFIEDQYLAVSQANLDNTDESTKAEYPYVIGTHTASDDEVEFNGSPSSFLSALSAYNNGSEAGTIKLVKNVKLADVFIVEGNTNGLTIDLNGKTLAARCTTKVTTTIKDDSSEKTGLFVSNASAPTIRAYADLNLVSGTISSSKTTTNKYGTVFLRTNGTLTVDGATIIAENANGVAIYTYARPVVIKSGKFVSYSNSFTFTGTARNVSISGGTFDSGKGLFGCASSNKWSFNISGGKFAFDNAQIFLNNDSSSYEFNFTSSFTGGFYNKAVSKLTGVTIPTTHKQYSLSPSGSYPTEYAEGYRYIIK